MTNPVSPVSAEELKLLPCPHCGSTNIVGPMYCDYSGDKHMPHSWIECEDCPVFMTVWKPDVADAVAAWNRRAPSGAKVPDDRIYLAVTRPEGYEDVHPDLIVDDMLGQNRVHWEVEILTDAPLPPDPTGNE